MILIHWNWEGNFSFIDLAALSMRRPQPICNALRQLGCCSCGRPTRRCHVNMKQLEHKNEGREDGKPGFTRILEWGPFLMLMLTIFRVHDIWKYYKILQIFVTTSRRSLPLLQRHQQENVGVGDGFAFFLVEACAKQGLCEDAQWQTWRMASWSNLCDACDAWDAWDADGFGFRRSHVSSYRENPMRSGDETPMISWWIAGQTWI